jgi:hypothetical protein
VSNEADLIQKSHNSTKLAVSAGLRLPGIYIFPCAEHVCSPIRGVDPLSYEYYTILNTFYKPYYSRLANYDPYSPYCQPTGFLATDWHRDELARRRIIYTIFQASEVGEKGGNYH